MMERRLGPSLMFDLFSSFRSLHFKATSDPLKKMEKETKNDCAIIFNKICECEHVYNLDLEGI